MNESSADGRGAGSDLQGAGFVLVCRKGDGRDVDVLLLRSVRHGAWGFPKGHLEPGESAAAGALRELHEETGLRPADIRLADGVEEVVSYTVPADVWGTGRPPHPTPKHVTYFLAELADPSAAAAVRASDEHVALEWCTPVEAMRRLANLPQLTALLTRMLRRLPGNTTP